MGIIVIVAYKPKSGKEDALLQLTKEHVPILRGLGLATDRTPVVMRCEDGTIVEVFEWVSKEAIEKAHTNPEVLAMWQRYADACDCVPLNTLDESADMFAGFEPLDLS
jgi:quinol monooxygenase YgiN